MNRIGTIFWSLILGGSILAVVLGFAGGRTLGGATVHALHPKPATIPSPPVVRTLDRALHGPHSLDEAEDDRDTYDGDDAVAARPAGWAPEHFDSRRDRPRAALVVVDAGIAGTPARAFVDSPIPFAIVVPADGDDDGIGHDALTKDKRVLIDVKDASAAQIETERKAGAAGIIAPGDGSSVSAVVTAAAGTGIAVDPLLESNAAFYRAARAHGALAVTRDVTVDARDTAPYLDAMFGAALAIAQRTGVVVVALHARPASLDAAERFVVRAQRDGIDVVPIDALVSSPPR